MATTNLVILSFLSGAAFAFALLAAMTGRWRLVLAPFRINPKRMTVARLGLAVHDPSNIERVDSILASFLRGFNETLTGKTLGCAFEHCGNEPVLLRPFAHEGLAMGYTPRSMFRYDPVSFERDVVRPKPEFRYLYYVGLGFWSGMRNHSVAKVSRIVEGLDPMHRYLVFDGYGFKIAFFDAPRNAAALSRLDGFEGYARNAAWQGVGRALYFRFMDDPDTLVEHVRACGEHAVDAAAGIGLAAVFVNPDRLECAIKVAEQMPSEWRPHVHLGMCFGLKARFINDVEQFEFNLLRLGRSVQDAIRSSIRECDRVELLTRSLPDENGYQMWRERVTEWMAEHIEYPMRGLLSTERAMSAAGDRGGKSVRNGINVLDEGVA